MEEKKITCIICPRGCHITVKGENGRIISIDGFKCKKGETFGENEYLNAKRIITTTIPIKNKDIRRLPVKSSEPVNKNEIFDYVREIKKFKLDKKKVTMGDVIIPSVLNKGIDIIACRTIR